MKIFVTLLTLILLSIPIKSQSRSIDTKNVEIICSTIETFIWNYLGPVQRCLVDKSTMSKFPDSSVSSVIHSNKSHVTNLAQITALEIQGAKEVRFIPYGIKSKLPNLKGLSMNACGLLSVNKDNLKEFGTSLEGLFLTDNKLISIDANLLEHNPNLKVISLHTNPLRHINPEFFANLKSLENLKAVYLNPAGCISQDFDTSYGHDIAIFKWNNEKCTEPQNNSSSIVHEFFLGALRKVLD